MLYLFFMFQNLLKVCEGSELRTNCLPHTRVHFPDSHNAINPSQCNTECPVVR